MWSQVDKALVVGKQPQGKSERFLGNGSVIKSAECWVHIVSLKFCSTGQFYTLCLGPALL